MLRTMRKRGAILVDASDIDWAVIDNVSRRFSDRCPAARGVV